MKFKLITYNILSFISILFIGCMSNNKTDKKFVADNVINISSKIQTIDTREIIVNQVAIPYIINDYLIIADPMSMDKMINIFDKNTLEYICSAIQRGRGPNEIANMGHLAVDSKRNEILVSDHNTQCILSYNIDSLIADPIHYSAKVKMRMDKAHFPNIYEYLNDSLSIGQIIIPIGNSTFEQQIAKLNMINGEITIMPYSNPKINRKRVSIAVSQKLGIYVECYNNHDLMTICKINGELVCDIYGKDFDTKIQNEIRYFCDVSICKDKIYALYMNANLVAEDGSTNMPTAFLVFDSKGNYINTLETGCRINRFCYDEENNRIILSLNDENQFAYFDID